jgi:hypothetical protein
MTESNKPEWFDITEDDGPVAPPKASKTLPLAAVLVAALILGVGAIVAQTQDKSPVNVVESTSAQPTASQITTSSTVSSKATPASSVIRIANPAASATVTPATSLQNPSIATLPTKGGDDDDEGDDDDDDEGDDD